MDFQSLGNTINVFQGRVSLSLLNKTQIGSMHTNHFRELFLRNSLFLSQSLHFLSKIFKNMLIWLRYYLCPHAISVGDDTESNYLQLVTK